MRVFECKRRIRAKWCVCKLNDFSPCPGELYLTHNVLSGSMSIQIIVIRYSAPMFSAFIIWVLLPFDEYKFKIGTKLE